jgi:hypothetical protein
MKNVLSHTSQTGIARALGRFSLLSFAAGIAACSSERVSLGDREAGLDGPEEAACDGGVVSGSVEATTQAQIDALAGCEEIVGNLIIYGELDLLPLASLRVVRGDLHIAPNDQAYPEGGASLTGLDSLEQVSSLHLYSISDADLSALAGLTRVQVDPLSPWDEGGDIDIQGCDNLTDLTGLGGLREWSRLSLQGNASLSSLRGIGTPPEWATLVVMGSPALRDISALAPLRYMEAFLLFGTGVERLDGLNLEIVRSLDFRDNASLVNLDGLNGLTSLRHLTLYGNPALEELPAMPELQRILEGVQIVSNAELRTIPPYAASAAGEINLGGWAFNPADNPDSVSSEFMVFEVGNNPKLTHLSVPSGLRRGQYIGIYDNPSLVELDMSSVEKLDMLSLRNNVALPGVAIDALQTVDDLVVTGNAALPSSTFDDVATFTRELSGNAGDAAP